MSETNDIRPAVTDDLRSITNDIQIRDDAGPARLRSLVPWPVGCADPEG